MSLSAGDAARFVRANTVIAAPPLVPEIRLHLASEITPLWHASEAMLARAGLPPPYWAFAWAGGQALARHVIDHPELVRGEAVLDLGSGSGLVALAAARVGAAHVTAAEIDPIAGSAIALNAALNGVAVEIETADVIDGPAEGWRIVLAGDLCYEQPLAERLVRWVTALAAAGATVLLGDPGRTYLPRTGLQEVARYDVPTPLDLEDRTMRESVVWRLTAR